MAKSDTWPGGAAMASLNAVDSAGSCDSVISGNSACSDDSMEHLSPEERACLMFLEETIEEIEMMEDSGLSNDELEFGLKLKSNNPKTVNGISSSSHKSDKSLSCAAADPSITPTLHQTPESTPAPAVTSKKFQTADSEVQSSPSVSRSASDVAPQKPLNPTNASHVSWDLRNPEVASEVDLTIIPPPLDFMDEPELPPLPEELNIVPPPAEIFPEPDAPPPADWEQLEPKVPTKNPSPDSEVDGPSCSPPPAEDSIPLNPYLEVPEQKAPPAVAPKPKSIPANIVLRSHKPTGSEGHSVSSRDGVMDPQKVRIEALRKLGLLKQEEAPPPAFARGGSLKTRTPQEAPISPVGSGNPPLKSSLYSHVHSTPAASAPDVLPAPAAFSDVDGLPPPPDNPAPTVSGAPPAPVKQHTTQKIARSATFEQCSVGQSTDAAGQGDATQSPKELRKMRPRPASMGGGDPAHSLKQQQPPSQWHAPNVPRESGKLPRSQGISVLICPRPENTEDRREALKKLGLLRY